MIFILRSADFSGHLRAGMSYHMPEWSVGVTANQSQPQKLISLMGSLLWSAH